MALNSWKNRGKVEKYIKTQANPETVRKALEDLYKNTPAMYGVRINSDYMVIESVVFSILRTSDILWVYHYSNQTKLYGVLPVANFYAIKMRTKDGKEYSVVVPTKAAADNLMKFLFERMPGAVFGYNQKIVEMWNNSASDRHEIFRYLAQQQH